MNLIKDFREINRTTLPKSDKTTIAVLTNFNDDSRCAMQYAVDIFGTEARYVLLCIYSMEDALAAGSSFPSVIREEITEKLLDELKLIRNILGENQPEILIDFGFGNRKQVLEKGWNNGEYHVIVVSSLTLGWFDSVPSNQVPVLTVPIERKLTQNTTPYSIN